MKEKIKAAKQVSLVKSIEAKGVFLK